MFARRPYRPIESMNQCILYNCPELRKTKMIVLIFSSDSNEVNDTLSQQTAIYRFFPRAYGTFKMELIVLIEAQF